MSNIEIAGRNAGEFLQRILGVDNVHVIGAAKVDDVWEVEVEIFEESSFMKSLGLPTRVQDRNLYRVMLNGDLEVESYERQNAAAHA
jgi:hypothetical protein